MSTFLARFRVAIEYVQGVGLLGIVGLILTAIVLRNFFGIGLVWIFEVTGFLMVWMVFIGAPRNLISNEEIRVDTFTTMLGVGPRRVLWLLQKLVILATSVILTYFFILHVQRFGGLASPTLHIPHTVFYAAIAVGPFVSILVTLWHLYEFVTGRLPDERL